jgi:hypothetical protein
MTDQPSESFESLLRCEGWWEQEAYGRQSMLDLRLGFQDGAISGSGVDIIGPFKFTGRLSTNGRVIMVKRYLGQHRVDYVGSYDGEGTMWGRWRIGPSRGRWLITLRTPNPNASPIHECVPQTNAPERLLPAHPDGDFAQLEPHDGCSSSPRDAGRTD